MTEPAFELTAFGWDESWAEAAAPYRRCGEPGRVTRVDRGLCTVVTAGGLVRASLGSSVLEAVAADNLATPCTGDWVVVRDWPDGPRTIETVLARRTSVVRAQSARSSRSSRGHLLATNVDFAGVVVGLHPDPNLPRIERLLTVAWQSGARPLVVLTKADLVPDADLVRDDVRAIAPDLDVVVTSTATGRGIDDLTGLLEGGATLALIGASGHGKSSLTNALVGADTLATRRIRDDGKGRHTSVRRELVLVPSGGAVIDTPGLRGVGLHVSEGGMEAAFPDVAMLAERCHFTDCSHASEPGCAVRTAVDEGVLPARRLDSWRSLQREYAERDRRATVRLRHDERKHARLRRLRDDDRRREDR